MYLMLMLDPNAALRSTIPQPPFTFQVSEMTSFCLRDHEVLQDYWKDLSAANMQWDPIIQNFVQQGKVHED